MHDTVLCIYTLYKAEINKRLRAKQSVLPALLVETSLRVVLFAYSSLKVPLSFSQLEKFSEKFMS
jgi:hypothetical protein